MKTIKRLRRVQELYVYSRKVKRASIYLALHSCNGEQFKKYILFYFTHYSFFGHNATQPTVVWLGDVMLCVMLHSCDVGMIGKMNFPLPLKALAQLYFDVILRRNMAHKSKCWVVGNKLFINSCTHLLYGIMLFKCSK